jgi:hypothetical protein
VAVAAGSDRTGVTFGSVTAGGVTGSTVFGGAASRVEVACEATIAGAEMIAAELPAAGRPQFVQKGFPDSSPAPQFVQKAVSEGGAASVANGAGAVTVGTDSASGEA